MGERDSLEKLGLRRLIDQAEQLGVGDQVPQMLRDFVGGDHVYNGGALAWTRAHPEQDDQVRGCCLGEGIKGPEFCTCWVPEYDLEQQPLIPPGDGEIQARDDLCGDCAYRPGSPELADEWMAETLRSLPSTGALFFCHGGMRRPVRWRHPDGREVAGDPADYHPPFDAVGRPYRADGRVAQICGGWAACSRRIQNEWDKDKKTHGLDTGSDGEPL